MHPSLQQLIDANIPMELNPPATQEAIAQYERQEGITLPAYYKEFLQFGNGGYMFGLSGPLFYGVDSESEGYYLADGKETRENYELPDTCCVVGYMSWGDPLCIDLETQEFVEWDHETWDAWEDSVRWASLFPFIDELFISHFETLPEFIDRIQKQLEVDK